MRNVLGFTVAAIVSLAPAFYFDKYAHSLPRFFGTDFGSTLISLMLLAMLAAGPVAYWLITRKR